MSSANEFETDPTDGPESRRLDLWHDLILPTLLFTALGGMTWAVRGCSGFGAVAGCTFAGIMWGAAWWYIAQDPGRAQSRRYASGWIILAVTAGVGLSGARGWMQWPWFFEGKLQTNAGKGKFLPISPAYGFLWLFIAGVPWAGIGACLLAWCGSRREMRPCHWLIRIVCGIGGGLLARTIYESFPNLFLPMYDTYRDQYNDFATNPNLRRLYNDCNGAITHMGYYLGFLAFEAFRREWKNVVLIWTVGILNGFGWALCQNWKWAPNVWPTGKFNWWRCWESSGGLTIGIAYGIAYFLVNRPMSREEKASVASNRSIQGPNFEWLLVFTTLAYLFQFYYRPEMPRWGHWYAIVALLFGLFYYVGYSRKPIPEFAIEGEPAAQGNSGEAMTVLIAILIVGGTIAGLIPQLTSLVLPEGRGGWRYLMYYEAAILAVGYLWYWFNRESCDAELKRTTPREGDPNLERFGVYTGLLVGLGLSIRNGAKGWFNIYRTDWPEDEWSRLLWDRLGPVFLAILIAIALWTLIRSKARVSNDSVNPHSYGLMWLVLIVCNAIGLAVTGPLSEWIEAAFAIYYFLLFLITAVIVFHYSTDKRWRSVAKNGSPSTNLHQSI